MCDKRDGAITCVFYRRDLHLTSMFSGLLQTDLFKGSLSSAEIFLKQNYCHVCCTRFAVFFPLPSYGVTRLRQTQNVKFVPRDQVSPLPIVDCSLNLHKH